MAKIRPVHDGSPGTLGAPWAVLPFEDAIRVLDVEVGDIFGDLPAAPDAGENLTLAGYRHVVVEIGDDEAKPDWRPGYYKSPLTPAEAFLRLQVHQRLGEHWRDEWKRGQDADGEPAMWLWAVLKENAPEAEWIRENRERLQTQVREIAAQTDVPDWVYVRFRKEEERATS